MSAHVVEVRAKTDRRYARFLGIAFLIIFNSSLLNSFETYYSIIYEGIKYDNNINISYYYMILSINNNKFYDNNKIFIYLRSYENPDVPHFNRGIRTVSAIPIDSP